MNIPFKCVGQEESQRSNDWPDKANGEFIGLSRFTIVTIKINFVLTHHQS